MSKILTTETAEGTTEMTDQLFLQMMSDPKMKAQTEDCLLDLSLNRRHLYVLGFRCGAVMAMLAMQQGAMKTKAKG